MKNKEILLHTYYTAHKPERALKLQNAGGKCGKAGISIICWSTGMLEDSLELSYKIYKLEHVLSQSPDSILYIHPRGWKIVI